MRVSIGRELADGTVFFGGDVTGAFHVTHGVAYLDPEFPECVRRLAASLDDVETVVLTPDRFDSDAEQERLDAEEILGSDDEESELEEPTTGSEALDSFLAGLDEGTRYRVPGVGAAFRVTGYGYELGGSVFVEWESDPPRCPSLEICVGSSELDAAALSRDLAEARVVVDKRHLARGGA